MYECILFIATSIKMSPNYDSKGQLGFALFRNLNSGAVEAKSCKDNTVSTWLPGNDAS